MWAKSGKQHQHLPSWTNVRRVFPNAGQIWPIWGQLWPILTDPSQSWPKLGQLLVFLGQRFDNRCATFGQVTVRDVWSATFPQLSGTEFFLQSQASAGPRRSQPNTQLRAQAHVVDTRANRSRAGPRDALKCYIGIVTAHRRASVLSLNNCAAFAFLAPTQHAAIFVMSAAAAKVEEGDGPQPPTAAAATRRYCAAAHHESSACSARFTQALGTSLGTPLRKGAIPNCHRADAMDPLEPL